MLSHVYVGITDFPRAFSFYSGIMDELENVLKFADPTKAWAGWIQVGIPRPLFLIGQPFDGKKASVGNGQMIALLANSRDMVNRCHARALALGGADEGAPALRQQYHPDFYGAYFRDPDSNKLCVCCHEPLGQMA
jgi:catechol 2,3-dioxygenase-like lactoylglutathione lyase family enzyme